jgi:hypothetical protein
MPNRATRRLPLSLLAAMAEIDLDAHRGRFGAFQRDGKIAKHAIQGAWRYHRPAERRG